MPNSDPIAGAPAEAEAQGTLSLILQSAAAADGNGLTAPTDGYNGAQMVELQKTGAGTVNLIIEGSYDGTVWYNVGFQQVDGVAGVSRSASTIAVGAGAINHVYQVLDIYPLLRTRLQGAVAPISVQTRIYAVPL